MFILLTLMLHVAAAEPTAVASPSTVSFVSQGKERSYELYVPASANPQAPLLLLLHGSGGVGRNMVTLWRDLADREGIVLAAPSAHDNLYWHVRDDGPGFFRDLVESVGARASIDPRRVYLFGHSGGAVYVLTLALLESEYFAGAAVHAGAWRTPREFAVLAHAKRRIPVALFMGNRDPFFPVKSVRETDALLREHGHPTLLRVIPRHRHHYARAAAQVNDEAWQFLREVSLNAAPRFQSYESRRETGKATLPPGEPDDEQPIESR